MSEAERGARVEVWQESDGSWRWRYVLDEEERHLELPANAPEPSYEAAVAAAHVAYPGTPVIRVAPEPTEPAELARRWMWPAVTGALSVALAGLAIRYRRWWLAPAAPFVAAGVVARLRRSLP